MTDRYEEPFLEEGLGEAENGTLEDPNTEAVVGVASQPGEAVLVLPSQVSAFIRTAVPYITAGLIWVLAKFGFDFPIPEGTDVFLTTLLGMMYYAIARALERKWPSIPWLGSTRKPLYTAPGVKVKGTEA